MQKRRSLLVMVTCLKQWYLYVPPFVTYKAFFPVAQQPQVGQSLLIIEASRSHSDTPQPVGLLWMSDRHITETST